MTELKLNISRIWKDRFLDLVWMLSIVLAMWTMWLIRSGNVEKYDIPGIITIFMIALIFFAYIMREYTRSVDYEREQEKQEKDKKIEELEEQLEKLKNRR